MTRRTRDPLLHLSIVFLVAAGVLLVLRRLVHADPVPVAPPAAPAVFGLPWEAWLAVGLGAFAGIRAIVDVLLAFFKVEAPLTKTLIDDHFRDSLQHAHDKLDKLAGTVNGLVEATRPPGGIRVLGGSGTAAMLVVVLLAAAGSGLALNGCATGKSALASGTVAALDCEAAHLDAQALADAKSFAEAKVMQWLGGSAAPDSARIRADLAPIKSDLGRCAIAAALAAATVLLKPATPEAAISSLMSSTPAPAAVRAQFEIGARLAGWPPVQLAGGETL